MTQIQDPAILTKAEAVKARLVYLLNAPVQLTITNNLYSLITVRWHRSGFIFRLHHMFLGAGETVLAALARWAAGPRKRINQTLQAFINQNGEKIAKPLTRPRPKKIRLITQGRHFDLHEALQRLQQEYFAADLKLRITWSPGRKKPGRRNIRLGSYASQTRLIRINPLLDQAGVPQFVIDDIIFHEILHHYLGNQRQNGRTRSHHATFKKLEKEFRQHQAAKTWIKENLPRLMRKERVQGVEGSRDQG
jgi:predicted SprT family Zn-dependent metalloprotease